jgi:hypothetical protein
MPGTYSWYPSQYVSGVTVFGGLVAVFTHGGVQNWLQRLKLFTVPLPYQLGWLCGAIVRRCGISRSQSPKCPVPAWV